MAALNLNIERSVREGLNDDAYLGGLSGGHRAKPCGVTMSGDTDKHVHSSGEIGDTATPAVAVARGHSEISRANSTL